MAVKILIILGCVVLGIRAEFMSDVFGDCGDNVDCMETNLVRKIDEFDTTPNIELLGGYLNLKKTADGEVMARSGEGFLQRIARFVDGREFLFKIPSSLEEARKLIEGARSSKLKKFILPFVLMMVLRKTIEIPISLVILGLLAFKGLTAGLIALVLSGATAFKSLLENHSSSKVSYEVVPQLTAAHWSRSGVDYPNFNSGYHTITQY